jgi:hypothetical protein
MPCLAHDFLCFLIQQQMTFKEKAMMTEIISFLKGRQERDMILGGSWYVNDRGDMEVR